MEKEESLAFGHFVAAFQVLLEEKPEEKHKAFLTFPEAKYLTMNKIYNSASPLKPVLAHVLSGMTNNSKVKKCLIAGTHLPNGKVHQGEGREQGRKKNHPKTEKPYGIDIRQEAHALETISFEEEKRIGTNFSQKRNCSESI